MNGYFAWARDLGEAEQGRVLLALGLLPPGLGRSRVLPSREELAGLLLARWTGRALRWRFDDGLAGLVRSPEEARWLEQAAGALVDRAARHGGLHLEIATPIDFDEGWLLRMLRAGGATSIKLLTSRSRIPPPHVTKGGEDRGPEPGDRSLGTTRGAGGWQVPDDSLESWSPARVKPSWTPPRAETPIAEKQVPARYFQARVEAPGGQIVRGSQPLRPESDYRAAVFIGARAEPWLGLGKGIDVPPPSPGETSVTLAVVFREKNLCPVPIELLLELAKTGDSGIVHFPFRTAGEGILEAEIGVYHHGRNLQTGMLRGYVGDGPCELSFSLVAVPNPQFSGLEDRAPIDVSISLGKDGDGLVYRDGRAAAGAAGTPVGVSFANEINELNQLLGLHLGRITGNPEQYRDLFQPGSRDLLLELARHGSFLLDLMREFAGLGKRFEGARRIQIVQKKLNDFFPAEFLYEGPAPEDEARICGGRPEGDARQALAAGSCCGAFDRDPENTICPLRFWSLNKVIERHAYVGENAQLADDFVLCQAPAEQRERVLDPLASAILAASDRADREAADTLGHLEDKLARLVRRGKVPRVADWQGWKRSVAEIRPHLLVLLPHHERGALEIGAHQQCPATLIREGHVRSAEKPQVDPIVFLIGCGTANAAVSLESFVTAFRLRGAAIVVSTLAAILGRHAGPAVEVLVEEIYRIQDHEGATFGDAMLAARRRLLAEGTPMILGLTSYGDADWRIAAKKGDQDVPHRDAGGR